MNSKVSAVAKLKKNYEYLSIKFYGAPNLLYLPSVLFIYKYTPVEVILKNIKRNWHRSFFLLTRATKCRQ